MHLATAPSQERRAGLSEVADCNARARAFLAPLVQGRAISCAPAREEARLATRRARVSTRLEKTISKLLGPTPDCHENSATLLPGAMKSRALFLLQPLACPRGFGGGTLMLSD